MMISDKKLLRENSSYPKRSVFCAGAVLMLLNHFIIEWKTMNSTIGIINDILFEHSTLHREHHDEIPV